MPDLSLLSSDFKAHNSLCELMPIHIEKISLLSLEKHGHDVDLSILKELMGEWKDVQTQLAQLQSKNHSESLQLQQKLASESLQLQQELAGIRRKTMLEVAKIQRETTLQMPEINKVFENWPLTLVPEQILKAHLDSNNNVPPLRVLLSPPTVEFDRFIHLNPQIQPSSVPVAFPKLDDRISDSLRKLLNTQHYSKTSDKRPVDLLAGAWDSARYRAEASMCALFDMLKSVPVLVLDTSVDGDSLNFRVGYWSLGQKTYLVLDTSVDGDSLNFRVGYWSLGQKTYWYQPVFSDLRYRDILYASAQERALKWKTDVRDKLLARGKSIQEIEERYGVDDAANLAILEEVEEMRKEGIPIDRHYQINQKDWENLCHVLSIYHVIVTGVIADGHFLLNHDKPLYFIDLLPQWLKPQLGLNVEQIAQWVVDWYENILAVLAMEQPYRVPELRLSLAEALVHAPAQAWRQVGFTVKQHFARRIQAAAQCSSQEGAEQLLQELLPKIDVADAEFLNRLQGCLQKLGADQLAEQIGQRLLAEEDKRRAAEQRAAEQRAAEQRAAEQRAVERRKILEPVNIHGWSADRVKERQRQVGELLGLGTPTQPFWHTLKNGGHGPKLLLIPPGTYQMGSTKHGDEQPIHEVTIAYPFALGQYPVTFAEYDQYCQATGASTPSDLGWGRGQQPMINVSWEDAQAYCAWLSQQTGHPYRLPTEAEWEYAARGGETSEDCWWGGLDRYAWYNDNSGNKTHPVGHKAANPFGLHDVLGNVWEWCEDGWEDNYSNAPVDGSKAKRDNNIKLLRGGSWYYNSIHCRLAYRLNNDADYRISYYGFRVCCVSAWTR